MNNYNHTGFGDYVASLINEHGEVIVYKMTAYSVINAEVSLEPILVGFNASILSIVKL